MSGTPSDDETVRRHQDSDDESAAHEAEREERLRKEQDDVRKENVQRQLDEALAASFPASDPVSIVTSQEEEDWGTAPDPAPPPTRT